MRVVAVAWAIACAVFAAGQPVRADVLRVRVRGYPIWSDAVFDLAQRLDSEGTVLWVNVTRDDRPLVCGAYSLSFDGEGAEAFHVGECDEGTRATAVRLLHRGALFDHTGAIPAPRAIHIIVNATFDEGATERTIASSDVHCSVDVRPFAMDYEHGTRVELDPLRYELVPTRADVASMPLGSGWRLASLTDVATLRVDFDVRERVSGTIVVHDSALLACGTASQGRSASERAPVRAAPPTPQEDHRALSAGLFAGAIVFGVIGGGAFALATQLSDPYPLLVPATLSEVAAIVMTFSGAHHRSLASARARALPLATFVATPTGGAAALTWRF